MDYSKLTIAQIKELSPVEISRIWGDLAADLEYAKNREKAVREVVLDGAFGFREGVMLNGTQNRPLPDGSKLKCVFVITKEFEQGEALEKAIQAAEKLPGGAAWCEANIVYTAKLGKKAVDDAPPEIKKLFEPLFKDKSCSARLSYEPAKDV